MSQNMVGKSTFAAVLVVVLATVVVGAVNFKMRRGTDGPELQAAASRISSIPSTVGDWEMQADHPLEPAVIDMLQCAGHFSRSYVEKSTNAVVDVALIVGPAGPTAAHTPEICYKSQDHKVIEEPTAIQVRPSEKPGEDLWQMTFQADDLGGGRLRVIYAWSDRLGPWTAAKNPRWTFGGEPLLYKLQLATRLPDGESSADDDAAKRFLKSFLPVLDTALLEDDGQNGR
jgi:hypothetical protein